MYVIQVPRRFVAHSWGGTETVVLETAKRLIGRGHRTAIYCSRALATRDREVIGGVPVRRFAYAYPYLGLSAAARRQLDYTGGNLFSWSLMAQLLVERGLDLLHLHTGKRLGGTVRTVARFRRIPYVVSLHGGVYDVPAAEAGRMTDPTRGAFEWGRVLGALVGSRRVLDDAAAIVCVGQREQAEAARRYPHKRVVYLPNGVDPAAFAHGDGPAFRRAHGIPLDAELLLTVGRLDPQKNQALLIDVLDRLRTRRPRLHVALVGAVTNEPYRATLEAAIAARGLGGRVTVVGGLPAGSPQLVDAYHAADVFVLPSQHEPFGIVVLEAWAAGRPVVASRVGGVPFFVTHGRDGWLFDSGAGAEAAEAVDGLLANPERARAFAEAGQRLAASDYSWERITDRLLALYDEVLAPFRPSARGARDVR